MDGSANKVLLVGWWVGGLAGWRVGGLWLG